VQQHQGRLVLRHAAKSGSDSHEGTD
jgi:hypothetical protein